MEQLLLIVYVLVCVGMIGLILLQQGKGADMGAAFGSGSSQTMFGPAGGGNILTRSTAILAAGFFIISMGLAVLAKDRAEEARNAAIPVPAVVESATAELPALNDDSAAEIPVIEAAAVEGSDGLEDVPALDVPAVDAVDDGALDIPAPVNADAPDEGQP